MVDVDQLGGEEGCAEPRPAHQDLLEPTKHLTLTAAATPLF